MSRKYGTRYKPDHEYDGKMDKECLSLSDALNLYPGIETSESCCGHGVHHYRIWFKAESLLALATLLYVFDLRDYRLQGRWLVEASYSNSEIPVYYIMTGPRFISDNYQSAYALANLLAGMVDIAIAEVEEQHGVLSK